MPNCSTKKWEALQPQRIRLIQPFTFIEVASECKVEFSAKVYADSFANPIPLHAYLVVNSGLPVSLVVGPTGKFWTAHETFDALTCNGQVFARKQGLTLLTLRPDSQQSTMMLAHLTALRNLKQNKDYPWMAVSKFTHFFNPMLFPIYDNEVIWAEILDGVFKRDYRQCRTRRNLNPNDRAAHFNLNYTLWAAEIIDQADDQFMTYFADWFKKQVAECHDEHDILNEISMYYATAFEFVAIGAADLACNKPFFGQSQICKPSGPTSRCTTTGCTPSGCRLRGFAAACR